MQANKLPDVKERGGEGAIKANGVLKIGMLNDLMLSQQFYGL